MEKIKFIKGFIKNWRQVGSIAPSSRFLASKMLEPIDFEKAKVIVELGPGLGCFTKKVLEQMSLEAKLLVFEVNPVFCEEIKKIKDSRLVVFNVSALYMAGFLKDIKADYVISGIPLSTLTGDSRFLLLKTVKSILREGGIYIQFQYSLGAYKKLKSLFGQVVLKFALLNAPPAFVYECKNNSIEDAN